MGGRAGVLTHALPGVIWRVVVAGAASVGEVLKDQVYQGTVLGPWLWSILFGDCRRALAARGHVDVVYADDLNGFKLFNNDLSNNIIHNKLEQYQQDLQTPVSI